ncbi:MAG: MarC family protein [Sedimentisphaerales bacterium]|nr:MarC family protein [Sedimentisphaerales bacterium]
MLRNILLSFIPLFVAVDAIGVLPIFVSLTEGLSKSEKNKIIVQSMFTASLLAIGFIFVGRLVFKLLGITIGDFMVAGGALLLCIAIIDMVTHTKERRIPSTDLGAVPLGTPLIVGPAVLATSLLIISEYGHKGDFKNNELASCCHSRNADTQGYFNVYTVLGNKLWTIRQISRPRNPDAPGQPGRVGIFIIVR